MLRLVGAAPAALPAGTAAWPLRTALGRRPVAVLGPLGPDRDAFVRELERSTRLRPVDDPDGALATVVLEGDGVQVLDAGGQPLYSRSRPTSPTTIQEAAADLRRLAISDQVRTLPSGTGPAALPADVAVHHVRVLPTGAEVPVRPGEHLFVGDRLLVRYLCPVGQRFISTFDVGVAGAVSQLTTSEPAGIGLTAGSAYELGRGWGLSDGIPLTWPADVPAGALGPRLSSRSSPTGGSTASAPSVSPASLDGRAGPCGRPAR